MFMGEKRENGRELNDRLRDLMNHYKLTVSQMADKVGGSKVKFYNLLDGLNKPDFKTTEAILREFPEVSAEWFIRGDGPMFRVSLAERVEQQEVEALRREKELLEQKVEKTESEVVFLRQTIHTLNGVLGKKGKVVTICPDRKKSERRKEAVKHLPTLQSALHPTLTVGLRSTANMDAFYEYAMNAPKFASGL